MILLTEAQKGWLAGIVDGEGCVSLQNKRKSKNDTRTPYYVISLTVANTDIGMIEELKLLAGGSFRPKKASQPNRKDYWVWGVYGKSAWVLLEKLYPYLITKKERAKIAIELGKRISARVGYSIIGVGYKNMKGARINLDELEIRQSLIDRIRSSNIRGRTRRGEYIVSNRATR